MSRLQTSRPIWHAVIWILIYVLLVNVGDGISEAIGGKNLVTPLILLALSITLALYVKKHSWASLYGLSPVIGASHNQVLLYAPLLLLAASQYTKGINQELSSAEMLIGIGLMICVGFIEELLFRGFLYQGIKSASGIKRAVIISGVTFGIGHVVNLLRGYSLADQLVQICAGIVIGVFLALLVAVTKSILPGAVFHALLNISGTITNNNLQMETYILLLVAVIGAVYSIYLIKLLQRGHYSASSATA